MTGLEVIRAVYEDDSVENVGDELRRRLPNRSPLAMQVAASVHGWAKQRKERRKALGLTTAAGRGKKRRQATVTTAATVPVVREEFVLPWRVNRPKGDVRPVICPGCGEAFCIPADPAASRAS